MFPIINGYVTDQINSNRPGEPMSAFAVGKSVIQLETGIYGTKKIIVCYYTTPEDWTRPYITLRCMY
jgi:hypothetical protein